MTERTASDMLAAFEEYAETAQKFAKPDMPLEFYIIGLLGEESEYQCAARDEQANEAGDVLWYLAGVCTLLGFPREDQVRELNGLSSYAPHGISEPVKKMLYHGRVLELDTVRRNCGAMIAHFVGYYPGAMEENIEKLRKRYPTGYVDGGGVRE